MRDLQEPGNFNKFETFLKSRLSKTRNLRRFSSHDTSLPRLISPQLSFAKTTRNKSYSRSIIQLRGTSRTLTSSSSSSSLSMTTSTSFLTLQRYKQQQNRYSDHRGYLNFRVHEVQEDDSLQRPNPKIMQEYNGHVEPAHVVR